MFLEEIVRSVDARAAGWEGEWEAIRDRAGAAPAPRSLRAGLLAAEPVGVIAECKHRSPSKGWLADHYDPVARARAYEAGGASGVSVLTEPEFFAGAMEHLATVRQAISVPVVCKDFVRHPVQIWQARAHGADCVLLIVRILSGRQELADLKALAEELGMEALIEVHAQEELETALSVDPALIGVNNRDLDSFETRLEFSAQIAKDIPQGVLAISESGIQRREDVAWLRHLGFRGVLVGESLMRGGRLLEELRR